MASHFPITMKASRNQPKAAMLRAIIGCLALFLLAGCLAPPKRHEWQVSRENRSQLQGVHNWPQLSTNDYVRVPDSKRAEAVAMLQEHEFASLDESQLGHFVGNFPVPSGHEAHPYLVRGVCYSPPPSFSIIRFDAATGILFAQQFTYDGEIMMPFRWVAEPNAFVVFLPSTPEHVYPDAVLGGDWIFRGRNWNALDTR